MPVEAPAAVDPEEVPMSRKAKGWLLTIGAPLLVALIFAAIILWSLSGFTTELVSIVICGELTLTAVTGVLLLMKEDDEFILRYLPASFIAVPSIITCLMFVGSDINCKFWFILGIVYLTVLAVDVATWKGSLPYRLVGKLFLRRK
jgi:hypothetical protein